MVLAILCSGQGPQHGGMFALTGAARAAESLFKHAATLLEGRDPRELAHAGAAGSLHANGVAQILCSLQALAAIEALRPALPGRLVIAGYSVGEVAAWGVAGALDLKDTLDLTARRAQVMSAVSCPGDGLLFVRGLSRQAVEALCERTAAAIAIVNPGDAFVLGGGRVELQACEAQICAMRGVRAVRLQVEVASHTQRLAQASTLFRRQLSEVNARRPHSDKRLLSGIDGSPVLDLATGLDKLACQISHTVQWAACLQACIEAGATAFLELGPGSALSEMAARTYGDVPARSLDEFRTLAGVRAWLGSQA